VLADGSIAVGLFNLGDHENTYAVATWEALGLHDRRPCRVRDLWAREDMGEHTRSIGVRLNPHECRLLRLTPVS
jgi:alpha-glucosidase